MDIHGTFRAALLGAGLAAALSGGALAGEYKLIVDRVTTDTGDFTRSGIGFNGASPGPAFASRRARTSPSK